MWCHFVFIGKAEKCLGESQRVFCGNLIVQTQKQSNKREKKRNKENSESGKTI